MEWLPAINHVFPGAGITPFTVWSLSFEWWATYVSQARAYLEANRG